MNPPLLAPSLLAGNHAELSQSLAEIEHTPNIQWVHLDIMDGHFVPNLSFGPQSIAQLRPASELFFDVHLMLDNPDKFIDAFLKAGAQNITLHAEPDYPVLETLKRIKAAGCSCGICINPDTPAEALEPYLGHVQLVLLMTVQPGFGGQAFREDVLEKIETLASWRQARGHAWRLEVDGGIDAKTGKLCRDAGADTFVAGTAFFKAPDRAAFTNKFQSH